MNRAVSTSSWGIKPAAQPNGRIRGLETKQEEDNGNSFLTFYFAKLSKASSWYILILLMQISTSEVEIKLGLLTVMKPKGAGASIS